MLIDFQLIEELATELQQSPKPKKSKQPKRKRVVDDDDGST